MENFKISGLVFVNDILECSGEALWAALLMKSFTDFHVQVYLVNTLVESLKQRYTKLFENTSLSFTYVRSIFDIRFESVQNGSEKRTAVFIDSIDVDVMDSSIDKVAGTLMNLSRTGVVVSCVHSEVVSSGGWRRLSSTATTTMTLRRDELNRSVCSWVHFKRSGERQLRKQFISIDKLLTIKCSNYHSPVHHVYHAKPSNTLPSATFDMGLSMSEHERNAKKSLKLPYMKAQDRDEITKLNRNKDRVIRAGGRIIYTPDDADDFDDSDPDGDLEI